MQVRSDPEGWAAPQFNKSANIYPLLHLAPFDYLLALKQSLKFARTAHQILGPNRAEMDLLS
jgi:hypothetical protein